MLDWNKIEQRNKYTQPVTSVTKPQIEPKPITPTLKKPPTTFSFRNATGQTSILAEQQAKNQATALEELSGKDGNVASFTRGASLAILDPFGLRKLTPYGANPEQEQASAQNTYNTRFIKNPRAVAQGFQPAEFVKGKGTYEELGEFAGSMVGVDPVGIALGKIGGAVLKSGKKVLTKADFDTLPPIEKAEVMSEIERLAYESNVRKGKITPQNDTLYGNASQPIVGELPAPAQMAKEITQEDSFTKRRRENFGGAFGNVSQQDKNALLELYQETTQPNYRGAVGQREVPRTITPNELPQPQRIGRGLSETPTRTPDVTVQPQKEILGTEIPEKQTFAQRGGLPKEEKITRDSFTPEFSEKLENDYKTFMSDTEGYGDTATGIGEFGTRMTDKGVTRSKDIIRNIESATRNSPEAAKKIEETFTKPFMESKGAYAKEVKQKLDSLYDEVVVKLGIKKGTKEDAAIQWYGEGKRQVKVPVTEEASGTKLVDYTLEELKRDFNQTMPNGKKAWENIVQAEWKIRGEYIQYVERINEALRKIYPNVETNVEKLQARLSQTVDKEARKKIYQEIEDATVGKRLTPRKDYFRHFQEMKDNNFLVGLDNIINGATNIDPRLIGVSEFTKPNSKWSGFLQRRKDGDTYTESALGGIIEYIPAAEYKINIEPNIPVLRGMIKELKESTINSRNANGFIDILMQTANDLAGKTNQLDRSFVNLFSNEVVGRKTLNTLSTLSNRMRANAVMGNVNTILAQPFNMANVVGYAKNPKDLAEGFAQSIKAYAGNREIKALLDKSMYLKERYLDRSFRKFDEGVVGDIGKFFSWSMELGDKAVADGAWLTFYNQATKKGMADKQAILWADDLTRKATAGRGIGEMPLSQKAKITKLFMPFQVEVRNAINVQKDLIGAKDFAGVAGVFITTFIMNEILEATTGRRIGLDPIDVIRDAIVDSQEKAGGETLKSAVFGLAGNTLVNYPGGSYIASAGAGALGLNDYQMQKLFGQQDPSRFGTGNIAIQTLAAPVGQALKGQNIDLVKPLAATLPRFGGKQLERGIRGLQDMAVLPKEKINLNEGISAEKQDFPASYSPSGRLRFALKPNLKNYLTAPTLGTWSTKEGKEYINSGNQALSEKKTAGVKNLVNAGMDGVGAEKFVRNFPDKVTRQREAIMGSGLTPQQKNAAGELVKSDKDVDYSSKDSYAISMMPDERRKKFITYGKPLGIDPELFNRVVTATGKIEGDKKNGKTINNSASQKKKNYIDSAFPNATREQLVFLYEMAGVSKTVGHYRPQFDD